MDVEHPLKLEPGSTQDCANFTLSIGTGLQYSAKSDETGDIIFPNPNGTLMGK